MKKTIPFTLLLLTIFTLGSCKLTGDDSSSGDNGGGGGTTFTAINSKYVGTWIRDDLTGPTTDNKCDEAYDVDGGGTSATESQTALFTVTSSSDANGLQYVWHMFTGSTVCNLSSTLFTDGIVLGDIEIVSDSGTILILKTKVSTNTRNLQGYSSVQTTMNAYNGGANGACGKTDWGVHAANAADFQAGCGVTGGDIGMDDFKMSGASFAVGQTLYWKLTNVDSTHMTFAASTDGGTTYGSASSLYLKTP